MANKNRIIHGLLLLSGIGLILFFFYDWAFNEVIPPNDFPGGASLMWCLNDLINQEGTIPLWNPWWFNGCSNMLVLSQGLSTGILLIFVKIFGVFKGLKAAVLIFMMFSFVGMYAFCNRIMHRKIPAFVSALVYVFFPLQISSGITTGHNVVSMFFAFIPVAFFIFEYHYKKQSALSASLVGLIAAMIVFFENEKGLILCVMLAFWVIFRGKIKSFILPMLIALGLTAFFTVPLAEELGYYALFPKDRISIDKVEFAAPKIISFFDRFSKLIEKLPKTKTIDLVSFSGFHYITMAATLAASAALLLLALGRGRSKNHGSTLYFYTLFFGGLLFSCLCLAQGPFSLLSRNADLVTRIIPIIKTLFNNDALFAICFTGTLVLNSILLFFATLFFVKSLPLKRGIIVCFFIALMMGFSVESLFIKVVPLFKNMRSPMWYLILSVGFCISFLCGSFFCFLPEKANLVPERFRTKWSGIPVVHAVAIIFLVIHFIDITPYLTKTVNANVNTPVLAALKDCMHWIKEDSTILLPKVNDSKQSIHEKNYTSPGLLTLDSYSPVEDMGMMWSNRKTPWYWLNWIAPKWSHQMSYDLVLPLLYSNIGKNPGTRIAAGYLSMGNCPYLLEKSSKLPNYESLDSFDLKCSAKTVSQNQVDSRVLYRVFKSQVPSGNVQRYTKMIFFGGETRQSAELFNGSILRDFAIINTEEKDLSGFSVNFLKRFNAVVWTQDFIDTDSNKTKIQKIATQLGKKLIIISSKEIFDHKKLTLPDDAWLEVNKDALEYKRVAAGKIKISVNNRTPLILRTSESYHPFWRVSVNGKIKKPLRVNNSFLGIALGKGKQDVEFVFGMRLTHYLGLLISLITALLSIRYAFFRKC